MTRKSIRFPATASPPLAPVSCLTRDALFARSSGCVGNYDRLRLLTGAAGAVLEESHPTTQALARAIMTWEPSDTTRARMGTLRDMEWIVSLIDERAPKPGRRGSYEKRISN